MKTQLRSWFVLALVIAVVVICGNILNYRVFHLPLWVLSLVNAGGIMAVLLGFRALGGKSRPGRTTGKEQEAH